LKDIQAEAKKKQEKMTLDDLIPTKDHDLRSELGESMGPTETKRTMKRDASLESTSVVVSKSKVSTFREAPTSEVQAQIKL